jgi:hypothetical protein
MGLTRLETLRPMGLMATDSRRPQALLYKLLGANVKTPVAVREAVAKGQDVPKDLEKLVAKIHRHPYKVTDEDVLPLKQKYSEDELFEIIVTASTGAALERYEAGMRALEAAKSKPAKAEPAKAQSTRMEAAK